ncbi:oxidoreductase [Salmonirosea aquatica]|uniref:SDR family NAD(P)-dependent oxidoreductase n=1 Tax=Salmonirosea aquatica TaxID=2654236 RepID=A0A7C9BVA1_9BACT|nr:SDR family NAD(P)-dependent oxidoreductase [Cytophagaceae bacterium SJW1-29]
MWTRDNIPDLTGKIAVVTGANTGIGYETAKALYEKGADVTIAARNERKAAAAAQKIRQESGDGGRLDIAILDLASLDQIETFAEQFKATYKQLDILVNNAGVMIPPPSLTDDGFEMQFGVNFIGHFALTAHLLPLLLAAPAGRVVTLTSGAATLVTGIDFDNLRLEKPYDEWREYATSKLADIIFTYELDRRLKAADCPILSLAAHPGVARTDLQRHIPGEILTGLFNHYKTVMEPWQGALPSLFAATAPAVMGGEFYGPDGEQEYARYPVLSKHSTPAMKNPELATQLWEYAQSATGLKFQF